MAQLPYQLLPMLCRSLAEGPWRCVVIMAGVNDVIKERCAHEHSGPPTLRRVQPVAQPARA